ncbi:ATP-binding protein [Mucilaginibacter litoreus]|uniref:histidine kinase n=1 Tax=Mucilaginibacter litoreus TaxID=1048221 RepID=A0ABW3AXG1_9SPHI
MPRINYYHVTGNVLLIILITAFCTLNASGQKDTASPVKRITKFSNIDSAKHYSDSLLIIAENKKDNVLKGQIFYYTSFKYYQAGEETTALDYARRAVAAITPQTDSVTYIKSRLMIAYMLSRAAQNEPALKEAFETLKITDKFGWSKLRIETKVCIADIYRPLREVDRALPFARQAVNEAMAIKDTGLYIFAASTLSNVYSNAKKHGDIPRKNLEQAIFYLERILNKPYEDKISTFAKVNYMGNLGRLYQMQKNFAKAEDILLKSLAVAEKNNYPSLAKHNLNELATLSLDYKNYKKAVEYGNRALAVQPGADGNRVLQRNIYNKLADAYASLGNYKQAYDFSVKENQLNDSILTTDQSRFSAELDKKYQNDKRLLQAANKNTLLTQQRNFTVLIAAFILAGIIAAYRWLVYKKKKEAAVLEQEHKQMAKIDAMKTRFFANISHELKTPLTLIAGPAEQLLVSESVTPEQKNNLRAISRNSKKLLDMVNELLDLGKMEHGNLMVKPQAVNLASFIKVIYQGFASAAEYKKISYTLTSEIDASLHIWLDKFKFEKVANNFISNAIKYTPSSRSVNVVAGIEKGSVVFSVQDNGPGIHPNDLPQIFDRYYQGRSSQTNAEGGTGIGLSIAKEYTELMGGHIEVENNYGKSTIFKAIIPVKEVTLQDSHTDLQIDDNKILQKPAHSGDKLVLLVEDHDEMVSYIASVLSPVYRIKTANNGIKALELLQLNEDLPDLIVSDVMMPEMDGFTLLSQLKAHPIYCRIPVIMLTALSDNRNKLQALNIGVDDYLIKPFMAAELLARTNNLLANIHSRTYDNDDETYTPGTNHTLVVEEITNKKAEVQISPADLAWLNQLEKTVRNFIGNTELNLAILSDEVAISERQLFRRIKSITGLTPNKYIRTIRLQIAREAIESGKYRTIAEIAYIAGFETPTYFSKLFKEHFGRDIGELL